ncbi:hypothetical protein PIB30_055421, partial [Stylosanthes scabra]|nr:hypothetical protein [Stylosanthes scabra]
FPNTRTVSTLPQTSSPTLPTLYNRRTSRHLKQPEGSVKSRRPRLTSCVVGVPPNSS